MRANAPARPELPESQVVAQANSFLALQAINTALRDAAMADNVFDALDVCSDALLHIAEIIRAEGRHHG